MRIYAHAAAALAVGAVAPLFMFQSPATSVYTDTKISSMYETQQVNETRSSNAKSETHPTKTVKRVKKVTVTVKAGESLSLIANAHHTTWVRLFNANTQISDPNIIHPSQKLTIPSKHQKLKNRYKGLTSSQLSTMPAVSASAISAAATPLGGANTYTPGYCTWYVKNQRPDISNHWGNGGYNWLAEARADGYSTGSAPHRGAIAVMAGHVAYVTGTSDHGRNVSVSEMNYGGGVGVIHTRTVAAGSFQYIY